MKKKKPQVLIFSYSFGLLLLLSEPQKWIVQFNPRQQFWKAAGFWKVHIFNLFVAIVLFLFVFFETKFHHTAQDGLPFQPPECKAPCMQHLARPVALISVRWKVPSVPHTPYEITHLACLWCQRLSGLRVPQYWGSKLVNLLFVEKLPDAQGPPQEEQTLESSRWLGSQLDSAGPRSSHREWQMPWGLPASRGLETV